MPTANLSGALAARAVGIAATEAATSYENDCPLIDAAFDAVAADGLTEFSANDVRARLTRDLEDPNSLGPAFNSRRLAGLLSNTGRTTLADHVAGHARRISIWTTV